MNPAAKQFDIVMGVDIHLVQPPGPVPPLPVPHPFIGMVFDPMDFAPGIGASVWVNGVPRAQAGTGAKDLPPHIPLGGMFIKPPGNEGEMYMGSATVLAEGEPFTYMSLPVLSCHDVGMVAPPRKKKKGGTKSMMLPTSLVLPIPMGRQVLIGGPPTVSLTALGTKLGLAALGKGLKKVRSLQRGSKRMAKLSEKMRAAVDKLPVAKGVKDRLKTAICTLTGHPVNVADGSVLTSVVDFELPGPIPFRWERFWFSNTVYHGPLGQGWFHAYDVALHVQAADEVVVARLPEGRFTAFPLPEAGGSHYNRAEKLTLFRDGDSFRLRDNDLLTYCFGPGRDGDGAATLHLLDRIEDPNGFAVRFAYAKDNALSRITDSAGRELFFLRDEHRRIVEIKLRHPEYPNEHFPVVSYRYDAAGNLVAATDALGHAMTYAYEGHLLTQETNRNGLSFYFAYTGRQEQARCFRTWGDGGIYDHKLQYLDGCTVVENSLGHRTTYYHAGGLVRRTIDPNGGVTHSEYNEHNELLAEKDPLGFVTAYQYDERGNAIRTTGPDGAAIQMEFNPLDLPVKAVDVVGGVWQWQYDGQGNLTQQTDPLGRTTHYRYADGLLVEVTDPAGGKTLLGYDGQWNLNAFTTPDGAASRWQYDGLGRCLATVAPGGNVQRCRYDLLGRLIEVEEPDGNLRRLGYDGEGNVLRAKDLHYEVRYEYAGMNRVKARREAGTHVEFHYDTEEQLVAMVNEHGAGCRFKLNAHGEVVEEQGFDGLRRVYVRDAAGRVIQLQRPGGLQEHYTYDPVGRVTEVAYSDGTWERFAYREDGELVAATNPYAVVRLERDLLGRVVGEQQDDFKVVSAYDHLDMRTSVKSSLGARFDFLRNAAGDVSRIHAGRWQVQFLRDATGLELEREFSGGLRSRWNRDRLGRPVRQETFTGGSFQPRTRTYQWDTADRLRQITDDRRGLTRFGYDVLGNLAWSEHPGGSVLYRTPDAVGNLFRTNTQGDRKYGPAGQLLRSGNTYYAYDEAGNLSRRVEANGKEWQYWWDAAGMLSRVVRPDGEAVTFTYDALGRRRTKTFRGQTIRWVWDGDTPLHEWVEGPELNLSQAAQRTAAQAAQRGGAQQPADLVTWLFEPDSFAPLAKLTREHTFGIVTDHLGTPLSMHAASGETVWSAELNPYGEVLDLQGNPGDCPFRFPGQYEDAETGLYYNRFRYYDPQGGVYISQDPIGLEGGDNPYAYVSDPNCWIDPLGLKRTPLNKKGFYVYGLYEPNAKKPYYIGITNEPAVRMEQHSNSGRLSGGKMKVIKPNLTFAQARGYEQALIEHHKTKTGKVGKRISRTNRGNKIDSFKKSRKGARGNAFKAEYKKAKARIRRLPRPTCVK